MDKTFFRCKTCAFYSPGGEFCQKNDIEIIGNENLCSLHSSGVYKHMEDGVIFKVENTLLGMELTPIRKLKIRRERYFFCKRCRDKFAKFASSTLLPSLDKKLLEYFSKAKVDITDEIFTTELSEMEEFQNLITKDLTQNRQIPQVKLCKSCHKKIISKLKGENSPLLNIFKFILQIEWND